MTFQSLLPRSSSRFERALEEVCSFTPELKTALLRIGNIRADRPKEALPFLIWELGLEPILPYITDLEKAVDDGARWQQIRGTPEAVRLALTWVGKQAYIESDPLGWRWDEYQLVLDDEETDTGALEAILNLTKLSEAAHTRCIRIHDEYDRRSCVVNQSFVNGPCFVNDWSGVWHELGPKVSFAHDDKNFTDFESEIGAGIFGEPYFASWANIGLEEDDGRLCVGPLPDDVCAVNQSDVNGPHLVNSVAETGGYRDCPDRWFSISAPVHVESLRYSDLHLIDLGSGNETWDLDLTWDQTGFAWGESEGSTLVGYAASIAQFPTLLNDLGQLFSVAGLGGTVGGFVDFKHLNGVAGLGAAANGNQSSFTKLVSKTREGTSWDALGGSWSDTERPWEIPAEASELRSVLIAESEMPTIKSHLGSFVSKTDGRCYFIEQSSVGQFDNSTIEDQSVTTKTRLGNFESSYKTIVIDPTDTRWKNMDMSWEDTDFDWNNARL